MYLLRSVSKLGSIGMLVICDWIANPQSVESQSFEREVNHGPICGLICVREILAKSGQRVPELNELAKRRFLSEQDGSTPGDLQLALAENGVNASCFNGLTPRSLLFLNDSVLLRVTNVAAQTQHWVVYCGVTEEGFLLADVPSPPYAISESELAGIWTGTGVAIGPHWELQSKVKAGWFFLDVIPALSGPLIIIIGLKAAVQRAVPKFNQLLIIATMAFSCILVRQLTSGDGLAMNSDAMRVVEFRPEKVHSIPRISSLADNDLRSAIIVDSRLPSSYRQGHVTGAINLPTYATRYERNQALSSVDKNKKIVVYCQSERCLYADTVAMQLVLDGYKQVFILEQGWIGLNEAVGKGSPP